ncbi:hypothetical protein [Microlunatus soli]|uniref:Uncharacterized protein n=1 Tax=Microlunatus soli TaxID=630515 RepID=A0A1H2A5L6_9ACTN|nr:hypothetical protein [Microlunatus soli]SDT41240.1 hypothetical protein SAMN04489812_5683 [Microlunatus soli]
MVAATSGDRLPGAGLFAGLCLAVMIITGCSNTAERSATPSTGHPSASPGSQGSATPGGAAARWTKTCRVALPQAWNDALHRGRLKPGAGLQAGTAFVGTNGETVLQYSRPGLGSGTNKIVWRVGSKDRLIDDFGADGHQQWQILNADYDGRWLAYGVLHDPADINDWSVWIWDTVRGGTPRRIGAADTNADGGHPGGPWPYVALVDGHVFWPQVPGGKPGRTISYLRRYNIDTGRRDNVSTAGSPIRVWRLGDHRVLWSAARKQGELSRLAAADPTTLKPIRLPAQLAEINGPFALANSRQLYAWSDHRLRTLYVWRPGWAKPRAAITVGADRAIDAVGVVGSSFVVWNDGYAQHILDVRSGSYASLTRQWGSTRTGIDSPWLQVGYPPASKGSSPSPSSYIDTSGLPHLPGC